MFAISTYKEVEMRERQCDDKHIVILLFVRPSLPGAENVIREFDYIHYNSEKYCSVYAVGYTNDYAKSDDRNYIPVKAISGQSWFYSNKAFVEFKTRLESRLNWKYSGELEIIVLQNNPNGREPLNFQNYVAIDVDHGIRNGYVDSFYRLMESLVRSSKSEITAVEALKKAEKERIKIKRVIEVTLEECKKLPSPVKTIVKDHLFYRSCIHSK